MLALLSMLCLVACAGPRPSTVTAENAPPSDDARDRWPAPETAQVLACTDGPYALEVAVVVFQPGLIDIDARDARHTLRSVETRLLAARLRDVLTESDCWGPVRVLPERSAFAALTLSAEIVHSDGRDLVLAVSAIDASGRHWLDRVFRAQAMAMDYQQAPAEDPFKALYVAIANALTEQTRRLSARERAQINDIAMLRYAAELAPTAFADYVMEQEGRWQLQRLPAQNDPMLARINRIRNQEALFIDTVDQQYVDLRNTVGASYRLWQRSSFEQADYLERYTNRASDRELKAPTGSFAAMQQVYSTYRSLKIQEQDLFELATGFDNETATTVMARGDEVVRLTGTLTEQYRAWRRILARIIELEQGTLP